jgi:hypothetical protein
MNKKNQQKTNVPRGIGAEAFDALIGAIEECRGKPPYDYQRIIMCRTNSPKLGAKLARRSGAARVGPGRPLDSTRAVSVLVVENVEECGVEMLESILCFVNRTRGVVVLLASGQGFTRWRDPWRSAGARICRRIHLTIEIPANYGD